MKVPIPYHWAQHLGALRAKAGALSVRLADAQEEANRIVRNLLLDAGCEVSDGAVTTVLDGPEPYLVVTDKTPPTNSAAGDAPAGAVPLTGEARPHSAAGPRSIAASPSLAGKRPGTRRSMRKQDS